MEQPIADSEEGLLERLGNALSPQAAEEEAVEASPADEAPIEDEASEEPTEVQATDDGLVELEADGKTFRVTQEVRDGYLRQSDYTRKTQDLALQVGQAQTVLKQQELVSKFNEETAEDQQRLAQIKGELARYRKVDLTSLDTDQYMRTRAYLDQLKDESGDIEKALNGKAQKVQQEYSKLRQEASGKAQEYIQRHIKDWAPNNQADREAAAVASEFGLAGEPLADLIIRHPGIAVILHKAAQFDKLQTAKGTIVQKAQKAPPVVKPGASTPVKSAQDQRYLKARTQLKKSGDRDAGIAVFERLLSKGR